MFRDGIDKKLLINIGIPSIIFIILGGMLSDKMGSSLLEILLGIFLIALSAYFLIYNNVQISTGKPQMYLGGAISGFASGLIGTGGAVRGITMSAFNLEKTVYVATSAAIDLSIDLSRTVVYVYNGYLNKTNIFYVPVLLLIGFIGTYLGKKILNKLPQDKFKMSSLILILIIGLVSIIRPIMQLLN